MENKRYHGASCGAIIRIRAGQVYHKMHILPDGSAFFIAEVPDGPPSGSPIKWNPFNKVVQDHRDGTVHREATDIERSARGLLVPWKPEFSEIECLQPPIF